MESHLSTNDLKKLKKKLPHGAMTKISELTGLDVSTVSKVLSGNFQNRQVIEAAFRIIKEANEARNTMIDMLNDL